MSRLRAIWRNIAGRTQVERDLDDELRAMMDVLVEEKIRAGTSPDEARRAAMLEIGGLESVKEQVREARAGSLLETVLQDVRYGARLLGRNPVFALTAILSLAIGIGANTAIFTAANALLFRPPDGVADPDRLVEVVRTADGRPTIGEPARVAYPDYIEIRARATTLSGVYGYMLNLTATSLVLSEQHGAERVFAAIVSGNYFSVLGVRAAAGRLFGPGDSEKEGDSPFIVLSHRFWTTRLTADPSIVGTVVRLNGHPVSVLGVTAAGFQGTNVGAPDLWIPAASAQLAEPGRYSLTNRHSTLYIALGARLQPHATRAQAAAELDAVGAALQREQPFEDGRPIFRERDRGERLGVVAMAPIPGNLRMIAAGFLSLLMAIVSLVLVIACANLAGVLLARAATRRREIAVRIAAGARRARLVRQLLTETLLLFLIGGIAGLALARVMVTLLVLLLPEFPVPIGMSLPLDGRAVAFTMGLSFLAAAASGLVPALQGSRADVVTALKDDAHGPADRLRLRSAFVVAQVACSILLVVAAGLFAVALYTTGARDRGFSPEGVEVASIDLSMAGYTRESGPVFARELMERVRALPGITTATLADRPPDGRIMVTGGITVPGVEPPDERPFFPADIITVDSQFFSTLQIPMMAGRDFGPGDTAGAQPVGMVSESTARRLWPGEDPIGKYFIWQSGNADAAALGSAASLPVTTVGVVGDTGLDSAPGGLSPVVVYVPLQQRYRPDVTLLARRASGQRIPSEIRALLASMDRNLPILDMAGLEAREGPVNMQLRIAAIVSGSVGVVGLLLAAVGIYGVTAYTVAQRTREFAVRLSLGADVRDVRAMVLRQGSALVAVGAGVGFLLAAGASQLLASRIHTLSPPSSAEFAAVYAGAAVLFAIVGLVACYVPARRATGVRLMDALRYE